MVSLSSLTDGQMTELKRVLAAGGLDADLAQTVIRQPKLADGMVGWLREQLAPPLPQLFVSLEVQLENIRRWDSERGWDFTEADFDAIDLTPANHGGLVVDVLAVYLPDLGKTSGVSRTFDELWAMAACQQPNNWRWDELKSDAKHLRLLDGIKYTPGIRRVTLDLGANWDTTNGIRPVDVRGTDSAHAEILAAAAHFPDWVQAMDGERVPYVWMPGYQVTIPGGGAWHFVPDLCWYRSNRKVELDAYWDDDRHYYWACPVRREL